MGVRGTVGGRLRAAIEHGPRGLSIRAFQREMEERLRPLEVRGFTYPSINSYLNGETSPTVEFLEHAADVLAVRLAYLAAGEGDMANGHEPPPPAAPDPQEVERTGRHLIALAGQMRATGTYE